MTHVTIEVGGVRVEADLNDSDCALKILDVLPIETAFNTWGEEFYFEVPVDAPLDSTATKKVKVGDIGYWPPGRAIAIFFGPTPASTGEDPVPASEVNIIGAIRGDARVLVGAMDAGSIRLKKAGD